MIILRKLITSNIESQLALNPTDPKKAGFKGLSIGIFQYLNLYKSTLSNPIFPSIGIIASVPPVPGASLVGASIAIQSSDILYNKLLSYTNGSITSTNPFYHNGIFRAIQEYLELHMVNVIPTGIPMTGAVGVGIIRFPVMGLLGVPCWSTMIGMGVAGLLNKDSTTEALDKQYEILSSFIYIGLSFNMIPPIPTTGILGSAFTGISFFQWIFIDPPDWPIGSAIIDDVLNILGLGSLGDLLDLSFDPETENSEIDSCGIIFDGVYECPSDCSNITPTILTSAFGSSANTSEYTLSGGDLCSQINNINTELTLRGLTSASSLLSYYGISSTPSYIDTNIGSYSVSYSEYRIRIFKPSIKLNLIEEIDLTPPSFIKTGRI